MLKASGKRILRITLLSFIGLIVLLVVYLKIVATIPPPEDVHADLKKITPVERGTNFLTYKDNWIKESNTGLWEMYVEGTPFKRGVIAGQLSKRLLRKQEEVFVAKIEQLVPSEFYRNFLRVFIGYFNRNINRHIPGEYLREIYGISLSASSEFNNYGSPYMRILNYHAAHDIGHALKDYALVGCTSFSAWNHHTPDASIITGRNFDFYVGESFAEDKMVQFVSPEQGHDFGFITWGGMIGVVSGMNMEGLTVTLNAAKSELPTSAATPITIVAREILQYASNIDQAIQIASKRETFVSEAIMVSSAKDGKTVIIEKSPHKQALVKPQEDRIICSNHFRNDIFYEDSAALEKYRSANSLYRFRRVKELMVDHDALTPSVASQILRNRKGLNGKKIGMGNEKAINQLIAHHSVIFKPEERLMWVSTNPYNLGRYVAYDLKEVFRTHKGLKEKKEIYEEHLMIAADSFLYSGGYQDYLQYKQLKRKIRQRIENEANDSNISTEQLEAFKASNLEYFETYQILGDYYRSMGDYQEAFTHYRQALNKEIPRKKIRKQIRERLHECKAHVK